MVFGSYISTRHRKAKDIDIALYFYTAPEGLDLLDLIDTLSNLIGKEVDLVVLNSASAFLRHQVMKTGIPLIIKDRKIFQRFRERTISDYDEYKFVSGMNIYDRAGIDMSYCLTKEHEK
jgi:hypothetical protein